MKYLVSFSEVFGQLLFWRTLSDVVLTYLVSCCSDILYLVSCFFLKHFTWQILFWLFPVSCGSEVPGQLLFWRTLSAVVLTYLASCCCVIPCQLSFLKHFRRQILFWLSPVSCDSELTGQLLFCDWSAVVLTYINTNVLTYLVSCCSDVHWHQCFDVPGQLLFCDWSAVVLTYIDTNVLTYLVCCCSDVISRLMEVPRLLVNWLFSSP
jgi:hypothetical protein